MPPQRCIRCGDPIADEVTVCRRCNPAGLPAPSSTQYHATVFVVVLVTMAVMFAWLIVRG